MRVAHAVFVLPIFILHAYLCVLGECTGFASYCVGNIESLCVHPYTFIVRRPVAAFRFEVIKCLALLKYRLAVPCCLMWLT